jgi:hypothetical protein
MPADIPRDPGAPDFNPAVAGSRPSEWLAQQKREKLRRRYRPSDLQLLFIGEAPPVSGRFFYQRDSGLYRAIRDAFRAVDPSITDENFLPVFQGYGCYLIDTCPQPVDQLDRRSRQAVCLANEPMLCRTIKRLQPRAIVTLVRSIQGNVERAASSAGWHGLLLDLPYPGRWIRHREIFLGALIPQLTVPVKSHGQAPRLKSA